jgi:prepilin-type N-terminal cleavage/methylation domain-containing protein
MRRGFTLIEVLVSVALGVVLIISAYDLLSNVSRTSFQTTGRLTAISRARAVQDQLSYHLRNSGLGVPAGTAKILTAKRNALSLNLNSDYFSYTTAGYFLPAATPTNVAMQGVEDTSTGSSVVILSFSGQQISATPVLQSYDKAANEITLSNAEPLWIAKGNYIGKPHMSHAFTINGGRLILTRGANATVLADGVESFDVAFLYDPPWRDINGNGSVDSDEDEPAVWCYDASDDDASYEPDGMHRILDTDLSGEITEQDDQNSDSVIEGITLTDVLDVDGNGKMDGIPFDQASVVRVWVLTRSEKQFGTSGKTKYLVGRRILSFQDTRQRIVASFDVSL